MQHARSVLAFAVLLFASAAYIYAQGSTAGIAGTVTDPNGAVIPNATVVARNVETNAARTVTTNGEGFYSIPQLPAGRYEVSVVVPNFKKHVFTNVAINVGQTATLNAPLEIADSQVS